MKKLKPIGIKHIAEQNDHEGTQNKKEFSGPNKKISKDLVQNENWIRAHFDKCSDLVLRKFLIGETEALICYFDGLADKKLIGDDLLYRLTLIEEADIDEINDHFLAMTEVAEAQYLNEIAKGILDGDVIFILDGTAQGLILGAKGWNMRTIGVPTTEGTVRGPNEAFVENLRTNTSMLRRRLHSDKFKMEVRTIGTVSKTKIVIAYLEGTINQEIIRELNCRLDGIKEVDSILAGGCVEQYLEDSTYSIFPQVQYTEKPDKAAAALLEGRAVILVDGTPNGLIVPCVLAQFLQASEDYYNRILSGIFVRWVRYFGMMIATFLPAVYIALTSYHPEMLPTNMALSIAAAREGMPFSAFGEAVFMEVAFELLREASIRMPGTVSGVLGIVGALIIGQTAVDAQLVAPQMLIVIAITAIGSFVVPVYEISYPIRMVRFGLMIMAALFGLSGLTVGMVCVFIHLLNLKTFGYPYLYPLAPFSWNGLLDVLLRLPRWEILTKPGFRHSSEKIPKNGWQKDFFTKG